MPNVEPVSWVTIRHNAFNSSVHACVNCCKDRALLLYLAWVVYDDLADVLGHTAHQPLLCRYTVQHTLAKPACMQPSTHTHMHEKLGEFAGCRGAARKRRLSR